MADAFVSGNEGYVQLGATRYTFGKWSLAMDFGVKKFNAFGHNFQRTTAGAVAGQITAEGPYNAGNMPLAGNTVYTFHLGFAPGLELLLNARVSNLEYATEIGGTDPSQIKLTAESDGEFTIGFN